MSLDCQSCGACCVGSDVLLGEGEAARFATDSRLAGLVVLRTVRPGVSLPFLKRTADTDTCVAFAGPLGRCRCTIYEHRPFLCRDLEPGSEYCLEARRRAGMDQPRAT